MCVVSMIHDQFRPGFPPPQYPNGPYPWQAPPPRLPKPYEQGERYTPEQIRDLIDAFRKAIEAAEVYDRITGQGDCLDPEKGTLAERVAEIEKKLEELSNAESTD